MITSRANTDYRIVVDIKAPPGRVFAVLRAVERWPEWTSTMTSVQRTDNRPFVVGSRVRVRQPKLLPAIWQATELDEPRKFTWVTRSPGVAVTGEHLALYPSGDFIPRKILYPNKDGSSLRYLPTNGRARRRSQRNGTHR
jgi:uncharacterized protein YndB with AHSA1/START domain